MTSEVSRRSGSPTRGSFIPLLFLTALVPLLLGIWVVGFVPAEPCKHCSGMGWHEVALPAEFEDCGWCGGRGKITRRQARRDPWAITD